MQTANLVRCGAFGQLGLVTVAWQATLPFAWLAIGFSGGELLSLSGLLTDLLGGDLYWTTRIWAWFALAWPMALIFIYWRLRRRS